jgi:predicted nucleic acid-binding protein
MGAGGGPNPIRQLYNMVYGMPNLTIYLPKEIEERVRKAATSLKGDENVRAHIRASRRTELAIPSVIHGGAGSGKDTSGSGNGGESLGRMDILTAGTELGREAPLVTRNTRKYSRIPGVQPLDCRTSK